MSNKQILIDSFEAPAQTQTHWEMNELAGGKKVVDGEHILARVEGPMFAPDGDSLNGRHYTKKLWELAISRNKDRLMNGGVVGTLGHDTEINDTTMGEGKISHKVVRMWIDEAGNGCGEIHILGTTSGRALNTLLRGGVQLQVSTRATGELTNRKSASGLPIIDEDSYSFQGIDFVSKGGIPGARPRLVEAEKDNSAFHPNVKIEPEFIHSESNNPPIEETHMSEKLLTDLATEKGKLKESLDEALNANRKMDEEKNALRSDLKRAQADADRTVEMLEAAKTKVTELEGKLADVESIARKNEQYGDVAKLSEDLASAKALVEKYSTEFGTVEDITETYQQAEKMVEQYEALGNPQSITALMEEADAYRDFGTSEEVSEKLEQLAKYEALVSVDELTEKLDLLNAYAPLGTPEEVEETLSAMERTVAHLKTNEVKSDAAEIAKKYKMKVERVEEMLVKNGREYTENFLEEFFAEPEVATRYARGPRIEKTNESHEPVAPPAPKSRADMLLERFASKGSPSQNNFITYEK